MTQHIMLLPFNVELNTSKGGVDRVGGYAEAQMAAGLPPRRNLLLSLHELRQSRGGGSARLA